MVCTESSVAEVEIKEEIKKNIGIKKWEKVIK